MVSLRLNLLCWNGLVFAISGVFGLGVDVSAAAQADDQFDGAVWTFTMTPKNPGQEHLGAAFRVKDHVLYQMSKPSRGFNFDKMIGKNVPLANKNIRIEMSDFYAVSNETRTRHTGLKGTALLKNVRFGEYS